MKKISLKVFTIASISLLAAVTLHQLARACGWFGYDYDSAGYVLFPQELIGKTVYKPFLFDPSQPYYREINAVDSALKPSGNVEEWIAYLDGSPSVEEVWDLVYKSKPSDLHIIRMAVQNQKSGMAPDFANNKAVQCLIRKNNLAAVDYLILAKRCEPYAQLDVTDWYSPVSRDTQAMVKMCAEAEASAKKCTVTWLKGRYAYQAARMAHYSGNYSKCLDLCNTYRSVPLADSYIYRRMASLEAGALKHLKRYAEARYRFAMLFDRYYQYDFDLYFRNFAYSSPGMSMNSPSDKTPGYGTGYEYCKNAHEKVVMQFMDAFWASGGELSTLESIYQLEPSSEFLDILLVRTVARIERGGYFTKFTRRNRYAEEGNYTDTRPQPLFDFVSKALKKGGLKRTYLWEYVAGHLAFMKKDCKTAQSYFTAALGHAPSEIPISKQIHSMEVLMEVENAERLDRSFEKQIMPGLKWMENSYNKDERLSFMFERMAERYDQQKDSVRALLCYARSAQGIDLQVQTERYPLAGLIAFMNKTGKSEFEEDLASGFTYSPAQLHEFKGTLFLRTNHFPEAIAELKQAGTLEELRADPFLVHLRDCHDCDFAAPQKTKYTKLSFAKKMVELDGLASKPGEGQARAAYEEASGFYNMSYYGNSWMILCYNRSIYDSLDQYYDCSVAQYYYEKAMKVTKDREFQARASFMAGKCEENAYYSHWNQADGNIGEYEHIRLVRDDYADTKFYQEAIRECGYFRRYAAGK